MLICKHQNHHQGKILPWYVEAPFKKSWVEYLGSRPCTTDTKLQQVLTEPCWGKISTLCRWTVQKRTFCTSIEKQQKRVCFISLCCVMVPTSRELHVDIQITGFTRSIEKLRVSFFVAIRWVDTRRLIPESNACSVCLQLLQQIRFGLEVRRYDYGVPLA